LAPWRPAELLPVLPHDRGRRLRLDADSAALVDVGAFGGDAADGVLGGHIAGMPLLPDVPSSIYKLRVKLFQIVHPVALAP